MTSNIRLNISLTSNVVRNMAARAKNSPIWKYWVDYGFIK